MLLKIKEMKCRNYIKVKKQKRASYPAGLAWEIATSPIVMYGRSAAQPHKFLPQMFSLAHHSL